jgi:outer membrane beta-barrel protein
VKKQNFKIWVLLGSFFFCSLASAQAESPTALDSTTINEIDALLKQNEAVDETAETSNEVINKPMSKKELKKLNISDYSNIISETSYNDYAIVQRNYMPKSARWQFKGGLSTVTNDVFYNNFGLTFGGSYHFNETWGVGLNAIFLSSNRNSDAKNIKDVQSVNIENLVTLKNTYGASLYFTPIYGKWSLVNKKVMPFEIYLHGGAAQITNQSDLTSTAITTGAGQLITLTRSSALDINLNWHFYTTKNINNQDQANNSMLFTVGYSVFWPKPDYR